MKSTEPLTPKEIEKSFTNLISAKDIQKSMDCLCSADSALQIGEKNETIKIAHSNIHDAYMLLNEQKSRMK